MMAFKEVTYLKVVCGEGEALRMRLGLWLISKHSNHKNTLNRVKTIQPLEKVFQIFGYMPQVSLLNCLSTKRTVSTPR